MSPTGRGVVLLDLISRISRMLIVMGTGNPWVFLGVPVPIPAKTPTRGNG
jgi:hypothetical protein